MADAIEEMSIAAIERHFISKRVIAWLQGLHSQENARKQKRFNSDMLSSDMGRLFMMELVVSSVIAFLLRYELDFENDYFQGKAHSKNRYITMYFNNVSENIPAMELLVSSWQRKLSELSQEKFSRRKIAGFMPGDSDLDEKARQLRAWTSGENRPKDENLVKFILNTIIWLQKRGCEKEIKVEPTVREALKKSLPSVIIRLSSTA